MRKLVDIPQPFGQVSEPKMGGEQNGPAPITSKSLGEKTQWGNHGYDHAPSLADKAPGALAKAKGGNPFAPTGRVPK